MIRKNFIQHLQFTLVKRAIGLMGQLPIDLTLHLFRVLVISLCDLQLLRTRLQNSQKERKCSLSSAENSFLFLLLIATMTPKTILYIIMHNSVQPPPPGHASMSLHTFC